MPDTLQELIEVELKKAHPEMTLEKFNEMADTIEEMAKNGINQQKVNDEDIPFWESKEICGYLWYNAPHFSYENGIISLIDDEITCEPAEVYPDEIVELQDDDFVEEDHMSDDLEGDEIT